MAKSPEMKMPRLEPVAACTPGVYVCDRCGQREDGVSFLTPQFVHAYRLCYGCLGDLLAMAKSVECNRRWYREPARVDPWTVTRHPTRTQP